MKFFVDRCAGRRLAEWLRLQGHDVREARELSPDPGDAALLRLAAQEGRILVTIDTDFAALVYLAGAAHCWDHSPSGRAGIRAECADAADPCASQRGGFGQRHRHRERQPYSV